MNLLLTTLFLLSPSRAAHAAEAAASAAVSHPGREAAAFLEEAFGDKGLTVLHRRGFVSLTGTGKSRSVTHVQWPLFEATVKDQARYRQFADLYAKNRRRTAVDGSLDDLRTLQRRPLGGMMTPSVRAAADVLAALLQEAGELDKKLAAAPEGRNLLDSRWGAAFFASRPAAMIDSPENAAAAYFSEVLAFSQADSPQRRHFLEHMASIYKEDASALLDRDLAKNAPSAELSGHLERYLADQRKLWTVEDTRSRLHELERSGTLKADAAALELVLAGLEKGGVVERLGSILKTPPAKTEGPVVRFSGPELHVYAEDGSATLDAGDTAVVSMAYWVYGIVDGKEVEISELGFVDRGAAGVESRVENKVNAGNGGPYTFTAKIPVRTDEPVTYRLIVSADGAETLSREVEVQPSPRYRELLALAAEGDREASSCMLNDALTRYDSALEDLRPLAGKRRFAALLKHVEDRKKTVQRQSEALERLDAAIDGARLFASKEQCDFRTDRARHALSLLADLPAGCDARPEGEGSLSSTLRGLLEISQRRREAQDAFDKAVKLARELEGRCRTERAVSLYAGALALLDADDQARCGEWEQNYTLVRIEDLPRASGAARIGDDLRAVADAAEKKFAAGDARTALELLLPALAKVEAMPDAACYDSSKSRLADLARAYGEALRPGSPKAAAADAKLKPDAPERTVEAVLADKARRDKERSAARAEQRRRQSPSTAAPEGP